MQSFNYRDLWKGHNGICLPPDTEIEPRHLHMTIQEIPEETRLGKVRGATGCWM